MAQQIGQYMMSDLDHQYGVLSSYNNQRTDWMNTELRFNFWQDQEIFPSSEASILALGLMSFLLNGQSSPGHKWLGHEAEYSLPTHTEVKCMW